jgi:tetratricopeptide (TPR) repeat protein
VVDQFEELFTLTSEEDRRPFINSLLTATQTAPITVLLTLRADFYKQAITLARELSDLLPQGLVNVGPLRREEWRIIIEEPAGLVGLRFEPGLVERLLTDVEAQPDSLPLLEYALKELWKRKQGCLMTHAQYADLGGIEGAVSKRADEVLAHLPLAQQDSALRALTRLIRVSIEEDGGTDTRLRVRLAELDEASHQLLQPFVEERLLVTNRNQITGEETIEVAHEALIRRWGKLWEVLDKDREFLYWRRRLNFRMQEWEAAHHDHGVLLQGALRTEAQRWLTERATDLTAREREFITWDERDEYQIEQILSQGLGLMRYAPTNNDISRLITLAVCIDRARTLEAARAIQDTGRRAGVLQEVVAALARVGYAEQALEVASGIANARQRAGTLQEVAAVLVRTGHAEQARGVWGAALEVAHTIQNARQRAAALQEVAAALARGGHAEQALEVASGIANTRQRAAALQGVAAALARGGHAEQALEVASGIANTKRRTGALQEVVAALTRGGQAEQALEVASGIANARRRAGPLQGVATALAETGQAEQALEVASGIENVRRRAGALQEVAAVLVRTGHAEQALQAARAIQDAGQRAAALQGVATALARGGHAEQARGVWGAALEAAHTIQDTGPRGRALQEVAAALAETGHAEQALEVASGIENVRRRAAALQGVAAALARAGYAEQALQAARAIQDAKRRAGALQEVAAALARAGYAEQALQAARAIQDTGPRAGALQGVAAALARAGYAEQALHAARMIQDTGPRAGALQEVAGALARAGHAEQALSVVNEARNTIHSIYEDELRSNVCAGLAGALASLRRYRLAREMADLCSQTADKVKSYTAILQAHVLEHSPDLAHLFEARMIRIRSPQSHCWC